MIYKNIETDELYIVKIVEGYCYEILDSEANIDKTYYLPKKLEKIYNYLPYKSLKKWLPSEPSTKFLNENKMTAKVHKDGSISVYENNREYTLSDKDNNNYKLEIDDRWDDFVKNLK